MSARAVIVVLAQLVVRQHFDDAAIANAPMTALIDHALKLVAQRGKLCNPPVDGCEVLARNTVGPIAGGLWFGGHRKERADVFDLETEIAGVADETQALHGVVAIAAPVARRAWSSRHQADLLVEADRWDLHAGLSRQSPDRHRFHDKPLDSLVTRDCSVPTVTARGRSMTPRPADTSHDHATTHRPGSEACGCHGNPVFDGLDPRYKRVLWIVIAINAAMFVTEIAAGKIAGSQALLADALDFLGDTLTYGLSLAVIGASLRVRASAALLKGISLTLMGLWVLGTTAYQVLVLGVPRAEIMGVIGVLALGANVASVVLLMRYKDGDANVRSVWLCSRNDAIGNVAVVAAALGVWGTTTAWPDLIVAAAMAGLFLNSSLLILRQAVLEYRTGRDTHALEAGHRH